MRPTSGKHKGFLPRATREGACVSSSDKYSINLDVKFKPLELIDATSLAHAVTDDWFNQTLCRVNECVVRLGVFREGLFHWHKHDREDEFFFVLAGRFVIELETETVTLGRHQGLTVPRGVMHRTSAPEPATILMMEAATVIPTGDPVSGRATAARAAQGGGEAIAVVAVAQSHASSLHACFESVARERRYLARVEAPPIEETERFVQASLKKGTPFFVAVGAEGVVGWCNIVASDGEGFTHRGTLGMGVLNEYRGQRIGTRLIGRAIEAAKETGLERVELAVFASNIPALKLYEKVGFVTEGVKRKARKIDGVYDDIIQMALRF